MKKFILDFSPMEKQVAIEQGSTRKMLITFFRNFQSKLINEMCSFVSIYYRKTFPVLIKNTERKFMKFYFIPLLAFLFCNSSNAQVAANAGSNDSISVTPLSVAHLNGSGTGSGTLTYAWHPGAGLSDSTIANPDAKPSITTIYTLTVTDALSNTASDDVQIKVLPLPIVNAGNNTSICLCASSVVSLNAFVIASCYPVTYLWTPATGLSNPNIPNPICQPVSTTTYTLTVTDCFGATAMDDIIITVNPILIAQAPNDTTICVGDSITVTPVISNGCGVLTYIWTPSLGMNNQNLAIPSQTTSYILTVVDCCGCSASDIITISVDPPNGLPIITVTGDSLCSNYATGNQWYGPLGIILGAINQCYYTTDTGSFYVIVNGVNCDAESPLIHKSVTTSINENKPEQNNISILPNPNNGHFELTGIFDRNEDITVSISDNIGRVIYNRKLQIIDNKCEIDISEMPSGVYNVSIISKNSEKRSQFLLVK
jgi:hypothetical protein